MFGVLTHGPGSEFTRESFYQNWCDYLGWARAHPEDRRIMHLLLDAGLASPETRAEVDSLAGPQLAWFANALDQGIVRGPSVAFISELAFFHLDLVLTQNLNTQDEALAFDMLCNSIGLTK
jgi:hypothetical protein